MYGGNSDLSELDLHVYKPIVVHRCSLETHVSFYNSQAEHYMEMKLTSITSLAEPHLAVEADGCKSWVNNLSILLHTLSILTANTADCIILLEYINCLR